MSTPISQPVPPRIPLLPQCRPPLRGRLLPFPVDDDAEVRVRAEARTARHLRERQVGEAQQVVGQPQLVGHAEVGARHSRQDEDERVHVLRPQPVDLAEVLHHVLALRQPPQVVVHHLHTRRMQVSFCRVVVHHTLLVVPPTRRKGRDVHLVHRPLRLALKLPRRPLLP